MNLLVTIAATQFQHIANHARITYPEECCGFLLGLDRGTRSIVRVLTAQNVNNESRTNRYSIDPLDLLRAENEARRQNLDVIGIYHSHPDAPAQPSLVDLKQAWPYYTYIVLSVQNGNPAEVSAWTLSRDRSVFELEELRIVDS